MSGQPSPVFTTATCPPNKPACTFPAPGPTTARLTAQTPATSRTTSLHQVTLTATAQLSATAVKPFFVTETTKLSATAVVRPQARKHATPGLPGLLPGAPGTALPLGLFPSLTGPGSGGSLVGAGSAADLFPQIGPGGVPGTAPGSPQQAGRGKLISLSPTGMPVLTSQVVGLVALILALVLAAFRRPLKLLPPKLLRKRPPDSAES